MSIRRCIYKGCENYSVNAMPNGSFTLFQFPKDPIRRQKWMELGHVNPNIPPNCLYMCSDHFDHSKHLSVNQRRNVLLGTAVPFPYTGKCSSVENTNILTAASKVETMECTEQDNTSYMYFDEVEVGATVHEHNEVAEEEQYPVESTIEDDDDEVNILSYREISIETAENASDDQEVESSYDTVALVAAYREEGEKPSVAANKKRRFTETVSESVSESKEGSKKTWKTIPTNEWKEVANKPKSNTHAVSKINPSVQLSKSKMGTKRASEPDGNNTEQSELDESALIDTQHVTTFIFKGEEYVQMPKDYYLKDKFSLIQKLEKYEIALRSIKQKLSVLDSS